MDNGIAREKRMPYVENVTITKKGTLNVGMIPLQRTYVTCGQWYHYKEMGAICEE